MPARLDTLDAIEVEIWRELSLAARGKGHAWRLAVLATVDDGAAGEDGTPGELIADARSVVLRDLNRATRTLLVYTDPRSPKARQIAAHAMGTLVMWSEAMGWQLRLRVRLSLQASGLEVSSRWARLKMTPAAQDYLSPLAPGSPLDRPSPERGSREHFAVLAAEVLMIDWVELHAEGHRRAQFDRDGRRWVVV